MVNWQPNSGQIDQSFSNLRYLEESMELEYWPRIRPWRFAWSHKQGKPCEKHCKIDGEWNYESRINFVENCINISSATLISLLITFLLKIMITLCYLFLKRKSCDQTCQSAHNLLFQIIITECYDYLQRKCYKQTDLSVHNYSSWNNGNTVLSKKKKLLADWLVFL